MILVGTGYNQIIKISQDYKHVKTTYGKMQKDKVIKIINSANYIIFATKSKIQQLDKTTQQIVSLLKLPQKSAQIIGITVNVDDNYVQYTLSDGSISLINCKEHIKIKQAQNLKFTSERMYLKTVTDKNFHAFVGKQVNPYIFDLQQGIIKWYAKNASHDQLNLRQKIYDVDADLINSVLRVQSKENKLKIYDVRGTRRRPIQQHSFSQVQKGSYMTKMCVGNMNEMLYLANDLGGIYQCDGRMNYKVIGKCKGSTTTVTDLHSNQQCLLACFVDGYARLYEHQTRKLISQHYFNKPIYSGIIERRDHIPYEPYIQEECVQEKEQRKVPKMKEIRKRNKVGLKYLAKREFDDVIIQQNKQDEFDWKDTLNPIDKKDFL